jgi:hypothetical protein
VGITINSDFNFGKQVSAARSMKGFGNQRIRLESFWRNLGCDLVYDEINDFLRKG